MGVATLKADVPSDFAERIRTLRRRMALTQTALAETLGVSFASVNRWENGQSRPSALAWGKGYRTGARRAFSARSG